MRALGTALAAGLLACACVVVPRTVNGDDPDCRVVTNHMELQTVPVGAINNCSYKQDCITIAAGLGVTAASAIDSGSVVVIGNVLYWAEQRAGCAPPGKAAASAVAPT